MGTDAVLLGCWAKFKSPKTILDIGSGTGVIGLIAAQRYPMASLYGIDPLKVHAECTEINYKQCAFLKSYCVAKETLQQFLNRIHPVRAQSKLSALKIGFVAKGLALNARGADPNEMQIISQHNIC